MKKVLSLVLCLTLLCGLFAMSAISVSAEGEVWETAYDWETDTTGVNGVDGETFTRTADAAWSAEIADSSYGLKLVSGSHPYKDSYISVAMTEEMKRAQNIRVSVKSTFSNDGDNPTLIGVVYNGNTYWKYVGSSDSALVRNFGWHSLLDNYYEDIAEACKTWLGYTPSITLTAEDLVDVTAILFNYCATWDTCYIDDIQYIAAANDGPAEPFKATFDVDGIEDITVDDQNRVVLPDATIEGKQLFAWKDKLGNLYGAGATVTLNKNTAFTAVAGAIELQTGAGIRWAEAEQERGIRFETYVTKATLDTLGSSKFELGALILPYGDDIGDLTVENATSKGAVNVVDPKVYGEVGDYYRYYTGVVDFERYFATSQAEMADLKLTAVSYVKVTYADGEVAYFYDHPDATNNVRTVAEVARAALADTAFGYTPDQIAILNLYTQYSEETNVPAYRTDKFDNPNFAEEVEFAQDKWLNKTGGSNSSQNNGDPINQYTPTGPVEHYVANPFNTGSKITFTLPESVANGNYIISFNTRGFTGRASAKVEVSSDAGDFVAGESVDFAMEEASGGVWWNVAAPTAVTVKGTTSITLTSTKTGSLYLYDIVLTPAN